MAERRDYVALDWVSGEIDETLKQACKALEAYVAEPEDTSQLRFCLGYVSQVQSILRMVEFHGAALFASEMELLLQAMIKGEVPSDKAGAIEAAMAGLLHLPSYLSQVKSARHDLPSVLLPRINDMRAIRSAELMSEAAFFDPELSVEASADQAQELSTAEFEATVNQLKEQFQLVFVGIVRKKELASNLEQLAEICQGMLQLSRGHARESLWRISQAVVEGVANKSIHPNAAVKALLKELDAEFKGFQQNGVAHLDEPAAPELLKNFLYHIARSDADSPAIAELQRDYRLKEALAQSANRSESIADPDAMRSVTNALLEELTAIKDYLDLQGRGDGQDRENIAEALPLIKRVGDTMAVLGLDAPLAKLRAQGEVLQEMLAQDELDQGDALLCVAESIIEVEEALMGQLDRGDSADSSVDTHHLDGARETVLRETRATLEQVKENIINYVASQWDRSLLDGTLDLLKAAAGGLGVAGAVRAERVLKACERYIGTELMQGDSVPEWSQLDQLADAISGVDYFLERSAEDQAADNGAILDVAAASVEGLGYGIDSLDDVEAVTESTIVDKNDDGLDATSAAEIDEHDAEASTEVQLEIVDTQAEEHSEEAAQDILLDSDVAPLETAAAHAYPFSLPVSEAIEEPLDEEIAEIFVEEASEVLETIAQHMPQWAAEPEDETALSEVRRAYHTLKGSGRMVGANVLGELAWSVEGMLNKVIEKTLQPHSIQIELVTRVTALVPTMVEIFERQQGVNKSFVEGVTALSESISNGDTPTVEALDVIDARWLDCANASEETAAPTAIDVVEESVIEEPIVEEPIVESAAEAEAVASEPVVDQQAEASDTVSSEQEEQDALLEIFGSEAQTHLECMQEFIAEAEASAEAIVVSDNLQRALHTLKGCARMAEVDALEAIVAPLEGLVKQLQAARVSITPDIIDVIRDSTRLAYIGLQSLQDSGSCPRFSETPALLERIDALAERHVPSVEEQEDGDGDYLARIGEFMIATSDSLASIAGMLSSWQQSHTAAEGDWFIVADYTARIAATARELELGTAAELAECWSAAAVRLDESAVTEPVTSLFQRASDALEGMLDHLAADQAIEDVDPELLANIAALQPAVKEHEEEQDSVDSVEHAEEAVEQESATAADEQSASADDADQLEDVDQEMSEIFMEEARDLLENIDETILQWLEQRDSRSAMELLQRSLHTLKGGARLTGLRSLGNLSHNFETFLTLADEKSLPCDDNFFAMVQDYQDQLVSLVDMVMTGQTMPVVDEQEPVLPEAAPKAVEMIDMPVAAESIPAANEPAAASMPPAQVAQEAVKIPAQVIEQLVNLAGETSINRGRVEEHISELIYSLSDMDSTIDRMQEQLRRLDIETEQQLIFRQGQVESMGLDEFDPLEMDRYSVLQQLSRSLAESASDIKEVKSSIFNKSRDVETLLLQQSRINTDLQEGLMRSRMVPFSRMVPRFRRIVRQVGVELGKNVNLDLLNTEGEMDRTILERMIPSFEHMLRNAVDHGIEDKAARTAAGKPAVGNISIGLAREAGDVVISLADDGRGIDLAAIRKKAIERGMMDADAQLSDHEVLQFILQAGFSTAEAVTQISGRGVGLDVVASEIKQIGGSVDIQSTLGQGTRFVIRLPFTVSVNRALMVQSCGETYALPLNTIEGIVRVSPFELETYYQPDAPKFEYAGQSYTLRYMGALLRKKATPDLAEEPLPLPVILVRSGEHSFAIQVDSLLGSREIVVKALGPQFGAVQGLSGATVLGDGGVVVILDLHAMMRTDVSMPQLAEMLEREQQVEAPAEERNLLVMVVDDSVTVRKVTSRLLERQGMDVLLAKDGVDAMQLLQDNKPDLMLLDIEMPRMDGFEVASRIKHSSKLKDLPIIMITSRTGEKHRQRAQSIGVDKYLGKPFQELELLGNIRELTGEVL